MGEQLGRVTVFPWELQGAWMRAAMVKNHSIIIVLIIIDPGFIWKRFYAY